METSEAGGEEAPRRGRRTGLLIVFAALALGLLVVLGFLGSLVPGEPQWVPACSAPSDCASWSYPGATLNYSNDVTYTVDARARDAAGNVGQATREFLFFDAPHLHAEVFGLDNHADTATVGYHLNGIGDLLRQTFLYLQTPCVHVNYSSHFR